MSGPSLTSSTPITHKGQLVEWFAQGATPSAKRLIGVEHEKPPFYMADGAPVSFRADASGRRGVADFIDEMMKTRGWLPGRPENDVILDIHKNNRSWSFEPGLQMEMGGAPLKTVHQVARETDRTLGEAVAVCRELGIGMLAQGYHPTHKGTALPSLPKSRYAVIRAYLERHHGQREVEMISATSTAQVNLGYQDERDMVRMVQVGLALQPVAIALFANSPFAEGRPSGYLSFRAHQTHNAMNGRYGFMLPVAFDEGFGFEMFVDYALTQVPMMGVYKGRVFLDAGGAPFQNFIDGRLDVLPGQRATLSDFQDHINTIWSEVRLRRFLEMRGADCGPPEMIKALAAFWVGLLYDGQSLSDAADLIRDWTAEEREALRAAVPKTALQTPFRGASLGDVAKRVLEIAEAGLRRRGMLDARGNDESLYLAPLHEIARSGRTWAERLLRRYETDWQGDIRHVFNEMSFARKPSLLPTAGNPRRSRGGAPGRAL